MKNKPNSRESYQTNENYQKPNPTGIFEKLKSFTRNTFESTMGSFRNRIRSMREKFFGLEKAKVKSTESRYKPNTDNHTNSSDASNFTNPSNPIPNSSDYLSYSYMDGNANSSEFSNDLSISEANKINFEQAKKQAIAKITTIKNSLSNSFNEINETIAEVTSTGGIFDNLIQDIRKLATTQESPLESSTELNTRINETIKIATDKLKNQIKTSGLNSKFFSSISLLLLNVGLNVAPASAAQTNYTPEQFDQIKTELSQTSKNNIKGGLVQHFTQEEVESNGTFKKGTLEKIVRSNLLNPNNPDSDKKVAEIITKLQGRINEIKDSKPGYSDITAYLHVIQGPDSGIILNNEQINIASKLEVRIIDINTKIEEEAENNRENFKRLIGGLVIGGGILGSYALYKNKARKDESIDISTETEIESTPRIQVVNGKILLVEPKTNETKTQKQTLSPKIQEIIDQQREARLSAEKEEREALMKPMDPIPDANGNYADNLGLIIEPKEIEPVEPPLMEVKIENIELKEALENRLLKFQMYFEEMKEIEAMPGLELEKTYQKRHHKNDNYVFLVTPESRKLQIDKMKKRAELSYKIYLDIKTELKILIDANSEDENDPKPQKELPIEDKIYLDAVEEISKRVVAYVDRSSDSFTDMIEIRPEELTYSLHDNIYEKMFWNSDPLIHAERKLTRFNKSLYSDIDIEEIIQKNKDDLELKNEFITTFKSDPLFRKTGYAVLDININSSGGFTDTPSGFWDYFKPFDYTRSLDYFGVAEVLNMLQPIKQFMKENPDCKLNQDWEILEYFKYLEIYNKFNKSLNRKHPWIRNVEPNYPVFEDYINDENITFTDYLDDKDRFPELKKAYEKYEIDEKEFERIRKLNSKTYDIHWRYKQLFMKRYKLDYVSPESNFSEVRSRIIKFDANWEENKEKTRLEYLERLIGQYNGLHNKTHETIIKIMELENTTFDFKGKHGWSKYTTTENRQHPTETELQKIRRRANGKPVPKRKYYY